MSLRSDRCPQIARATRSCLLVAGALIAACSPPSPARQRFDTTTALRPGQRLLRGAGATFPARLYTRWFAAYQRAHPDLVVRYEPVGSGEGVRRFMGVSVDPDEQVDFGASDAAMTDEQIARTLGGALMVPMTAGSVVLAYNLPGLAGSLRVPRRALAGIFLGEITRWNDPRLAGANPSLKLPRRTITTVVRQDASGTTFAFTKHLDAISADWRARYGPVTLANWQGNAIRAKGNEGVAAAVQASEGSIGYMGYEVARQLGLTIALVENRSGRFVAPSPASAVAGLAPLDLPRNLRAFVPDPDGADAYPIVTLTWILVRASYSDARTAAAVRDLFGWCLGDAQAEAETLGFVPLPPNVRTRSRAALEQVKPRQASDGGEVQ